MLLSGIQNFPVYIEVIEWRDSYPSYNVPVIDKYRIDMVLYR